jgi:tetratricopeptide (TPR) repeat protein
MKIGLSLSLLALLSAACAAPPARPAAPPPAPKVEDVGPAVRPDPPTLSELLKRIEADYRRGDYAGGLQAVKEALELSQNDVSSMDRIGSIYYVLGRYADALSIWSRALPLETNMEKRRELANSISVARRELGLADEAFAVAPATAPAAASAAPAPAQKKLTAAAREREVQALYKKGVKYYAAGEYLEATAAFLKIRELDPGNADAAKALKRLQLGP